MRIASLVPSATETLFALGLEDEVVAVTHECDYPPAAQGLPHLTRSVLRDGLAAAEIDEAVRERTQRGEAIYELNTSLLFDLEPDLIVTQELCPVCAVSVDDVRAIAQELDPAPQVLSLDPTTIGEVLADIRTVGMATDSIDEAEALVESLADRLDAVQAAVEGADPVPVVTLEWFDPPYVGGHWVPQMVEMAGGLDLLGLPGERSREVSWDDIHGAEARIAICMPCGYDLDAVSDAIAASPQVRELAQQIQVVGVDASGHFSRPGPRLVDGVEALAQILHPERVMPPDEPAWFGVGQTVES